MSMPDLLTGPSVSPPATSPASSSQATTTTSATEATSNPAGLHAYRKPTPNRRHYTAEKKLQYVADFETTTDAADCRVWGWGLCAIGDDWQELGLDNVEVGTDIASFFDAISEVNTVTSFHNLKFDGRFILAWLLENGFEFSDGSGKSEPGTFRTLISDMGDFYTIRVHWLTGFTTEFRDSYKKLPLSVERIARDWKMDVTKGDLDYEKPRAVGYVPSDEEWDYIRRDVLIVARALGQSLATGAGKLTVGADALTDYKRGMGAKKFLRTFPVLSYAMDAEIRRAYRGGFTYADPRYSGTIREWDGMVLDVNSLYPSVMYSQPIPYGEPEFMRGRVDPTPSHPLTIFAVTFTAKLKPDHIPCIQIKGNLRFVPTEYQTELTEPTTLMMTNVDWELMNDHYDVDVYAWEGGWRFRCATGLFDEYIDRWMRVKANSSGGIREIAKLHLNALYGKFATNPNVTGKFPVLTEEGTVRLQLGPEEQRAPVYTAAGVFITSYARDVTVRAAQANFDAFAYADTDSLHLVARNPKGVRVHPSELGAWKHEYDFDAAYYIRAKAYFERAVDGSFHNAVSGIPTPISKLLTFEDLQPGSEVHVRKIDGQYIKHTAPTDATAGVLVHGKLIPKTVPGGVVLSDVPYELHLADARVLAAAVSH